MFVFSAAAVEYTQQRRNKKKNAHLRHTHFSPLILLLLLGKILGFERASADRQLRKENNTQNFENKCILLYLKIFQQITTTSKRERTILAESNFGHVRIIK